MIKKSVLFSLFSVNLSVELKYIFKDYGKTRDVYTVFVFLFGHTDFIQGRLDSNKSEHACSKEKKNGTFFLAS